MKHPGPIPPFMRRSTYGLGALFAVTCGSFAFAQAPGPRIGFVYPAGGRQGTTFTVSVGGQNLIGASAAPFSNPGTAVKIIGYERPLTQKEINDLREKSQLLQDKRAAVRADPTQPPFTAEDEKAAADIRQILATRGNRQATPALAETVTLEITLSPTAPLGEHEFRLRTTAGLSNPLVFCVGQLPENSDPIVTATANAGAQRPRIADPRTRRQAEREIVLPAVVNGQILPGEADRFRFAARQGQRLTFAVAARALLPYLADAVPGWFQATLAIHDAAGRELAYADDDRFNPDPVLACEIPEDGTYTIEIKDAIYRGREDFVYRITAGELPFVTGIFPLGGIVADRVTFALKGWNLPGTSLEVDTRTKPPGGYLLSVQEHGFQSNPVRFALDTQPSSLESESNDSGADAQRLTLPAILDGRIERAGDEDIFRFDGTGGTEIIAEVRARRLGSPLDSVLTLSDATGRRLASNDDWDDKAAGLLTHQADSRVGFVLPVDGTYTLRVTDAQHRGGPDYSYRLRVGPPQPGFELRVVPSTINVRAGTSVAITVYALRRDGFTGEIALALANAPAGITLSGARIPAHQEMVRLTLNAPSSAGDDSPPLRLVGAATIGGRRVTHPAVPADDMMQAFAYRHLVPARELRVCVVGRGTMFRIASPLPIRLELNQGIRIRVATPALKNYRNLAFELADPPPGIAVRSVSPEGDFAVIVLWCDGTKARPGTQGNLILQAHGERPGNPGPNSAPRAQRFPLGTVPAIPFEVAAPRAPST